MNKEFFELDSVIHNTSKGSEWLISDYVQHLFNNHDVINLKYVSERIAVFREQISSENFCIRVSYESIRMSRIIIFHTTHQLIMDIFMVSANIRKVKKYLDELKGVLIPTELLVNKSIYNLWKTSDLFKKENRVICYIGRDCGLKPETDDAFPRHSVFGGLPEIDSIVSGKYRDNKNLIFIRSLSVGFHAYVNIVCDIDTLVERNFNFNNLFMVTMLEIIKYQKGSITRTILEKNIERFSEYISPENQLLWELCNNE